MGRPKYEGADGRWRSRNRWFQWPILVLLAVSSPLLIFTVPFFFFRMLLEWTDERELIAGANRAARIIKESKDAK